MIAELLACIFGTFTILDILMEGKIARKIHGLLSRSEK